MTKENHFIELKLTLQKFGIKLFIFQSLQNNSEMESMFFHILWVDQDVINEYNHKLIQIGVEHPIHEVHECNWCIR